MAQLSNTAIDYVASGKPFSLSGVTSFSVECEVMPCFCHQEEVKT